MNRRSRVRLFAGLAVMLILGSVAYAVYRMALTPQQLAALRASGSPVDWNAVQDDDRRRLKLSILTNITGKPGSWIQRRIEQRFNVDLQPIFLSPAAFDYTKPLMMAGGDIPDIFLDPDPIMVQRDAYHGFLLEIPYALIRKYAPTMCAS